MPTFQFPKDNQDAYLGTVTFRRITYTPPEFNLGAFSFNRGPGTISNFLNADEGFAVASAVTSIEGEETTTGPDDGTRGDGEEPSLDDVNISDEVVSAGTEEIDYTTGVKLYLPAQISISDGVNYENLSLGAIGAGVEAGVRSGQGALSSLKRGVTDATRSAFDVLTGNATAGSAGRLAAVRLAEYSAPDTVSGAIRSGLATSVNPNTRSLFKSVNLREFSFTFTLIANSASEAQEIEDIIKYFRTELYPESIDVNGLSLGYNFPNKFQITFDYNNIEVGTKILPSHLRSMQTVYNPNSMGWHADGKPSEVQITLAFGEARTLSKSDISGGY